MESKLFKISFVGLRDGTHDFDFAVDNKFFESFGYQDFNAASMTVDVQMKKSATLLEFAIAAHGTVRVPCDLTNELYDQPIEGSLKIIVKFGQEYDDTHDEILIIPHGSYEVDLSQYVYELVLLSLPSRFVHPGIADGTLQSDILDKLEELQPKEKELDNINDNDAVDPRWEALRKLK